MALSETERQLISSRLADAQQQLHLLATGQAVRVVVDQNGERVEYGAATSANLQKYIAELQRTLGTVTVSGPLQVWF